MTPAQLATWAACEDALRTVGVDEATLARMRRAQAGRIEAALMDHASAIAEEMGIPVATPKLCRSCYGAGRTLTAGGAATCRSCAGSGLSPVEAPVAAPATQPTEPGCRDCGSLESVGGLCWDCSVRHDNRSAPPAIVSPSPAQEP